MVEANWRLNFDRRILLFGNWGMKVKDLIKLIEKDGWFLVITKGGHRQSHHPAKGGAVTAAGKERIDAPIGALSVEASGIEKIEM